ncbi:succinate dehydrogenase hydrophobic membrane anchor subunit [Halogeometricum borinquense]|uniref:Succinate dehydrogenase subunit D n=2 Tax=Halogeometricum borinquense TaxID=60847 RepID=E4NRT6_HALBP|nr:succinate dehydrogenase hydrophobic membrane anchor subunit [Halogeometricum borinquense]ADQ66873.1 succinate dehydrogenase subunit D [Halogeometricum borinquense DSM 11551]ELY30380.1 succinate dehydrogenase subunit D [Halogeometricum borinquense DSM 11551]QIB74815.1 succinate dehydrogenase hydrophobic membrane anchor subunit [Halogeometricum borinquense]QIQ76187.1 succinate dehydrogenase hydrophobic membrane anchor subunit [Halogeometricum borinquense]
MAEHYSSFERGGRRWLWQRITAAFLVVVLAFHFFLLHFVHHAADVTFQMSAARMQQWTYYSLMVLFLITATFHGVNGVYNALVNQGIEGTRKTAVKWTLIAASILLIVQGIRTANEWAGIALLPF